MGSRFCRLALLCLLLLTGSTISEVCLLRSSSGCPSY